MMVDLERKGPVKGDGEGGGVGRIGRRRRERRRRDKELSEELVRLAREMRLLCNGI
jgi:hypothetical protein